MAVASVRRDRLGSRAACCAPVCLLRTPLVVVVLLLLFLGAVCVTPTVAAAAHGDRPHNVSQSMLFAPSPSSSLGVLPCPALNCTQCLSSLGCSYCDGRCVDGSQRCSAGMSIVQCPEYCASRYQTCEDALSHGCGWTSPYDPNNALAPGSDPLLCTKQDWRLCSQFTTCGQCLLVPSCSWNVMSGCYADGSLSDLRVCAAPYGVGYDYERPQSSCIQCALWAKSYLNDSIVQVASTLGLTTLPNGFFSGESLYFPQASLQFHPVGGCSVRIEQVGYMPLPYTQHYSWPSQPAAAPLSILPTGSIQACFTEPFDSGGDSAAAAVQRGREAYGTAVRTVLRRWSQGWMRMLGRAPSPPLSTSPASSSSSDRSTSSNNSSAQTAVGAQLAFVYGNLFALPQTDVLRVVLVAAACVLGVITAAGSFLLCPWHVFRPAQRSIATRLRQLDVQRSVVDLAPAPGAPLKRPPSAYGGFATFALLLGVLVASVYEGLVYNDFENVNMIRESGRGGQQWRYMVPPLTGTVLLMDAQCDQLSAPRVATLSDQVRLPPVANRSADGAAVLPLADALRWADLTARSPLPDPTQSRTGEVLTCQIGAPGVEQRACLLSFRVLPFAGGTTVFTVGLAGSGFTADSAALFSLYSYTSSTNLTRSFASEVTSCANLLPRRYNAVRLADRNSQLLFAASTLNCTDERCPLLQPNMSRAGAIEVNVQASIRQRCDYSVLSGIDCPVEAGLLFDADLQARQSTADGRVDPGGRPVPQNWTLVVHVQSGSEQVLVARQSFLFLASRVLGYAGSALALQGLLRFILGFCAESPVMRTFLLGCCLPFLLCLSTVDSVFPAAASRFGLLLGGAMFAYVLGHVAFVAHATIVREAVAELPQGSFYGLTSPLIGFSLLMACFWLTLVAVKYFVVLLRSGRSADAKLSHCGSQRVLGHHSDALIAFVAGACFAMVAVAVTFARVLPQRGPSLRVERGVLLGLALHLAFVPLVYALAVPFAQPLALADTSAQSVFVTVALVNPLLVASLLMFVALATPTLAHIEEEEDQYLARGSLDGVTATVGLPFSAGKVAEGQAPLELSAVVLSGAGTTALPPLPLLSSPSSAASAPVSARRPFGGLLSIVLGMLLSCFFAPFVALAGLSRRCPRNFALQGGVMCAIVTAAVISPTSLVAIVDEGVYLGGMALLMGAMYISLPVMALSLRPSGPQRDGPACWAVLAGIVGPLVVFNYHGLYRLFGSRQAERVLFIMHCVFVTAVAWLPTLFLEYSQYPPAAASRVQPLLAIWSTCLVWLVVATAVAVHVRTRAMPPLHPDRRDYAVLAGDETPDGPDVAQVATGASLATESTPLTAQ